MKPKDFKNETKFIDGFMIDKYNIITTDAWYFRVSEPSSIMGNHSSISSTKDKDEKVLWWGEVMSRRSDFELPMSEYPAFSQKRSDECKRIRAKLANLCYEIIIKAFPEATKGKKENGAIYMDVPGTRDWWKNKKI